MDADFSHNPKDLERLREACMDGAGIAVGSRYTKGGCVDVWMCGCGCVDVWMCGCVDVCMCEPSPILIRIM